jgi:hypothetical protein
MSNDAPPALQTAGNDASIDPLAALKYTAKTGKRAVYEEFTFEPREGGDVVVTNESHGDDGEDHSYTVHVTSGVPSDCTCPAWEYHDGACKHMVATALRPTLCEVGDAGAESQLATDGGIIEADDDGEILTDERDADGAATDGEVYTYHHESYAEGAARYVRCERCGAECVPADPDRLAHREGCPEGDR